MRRGEALERKEQALGQELEVEVRVEPCCSSRRGPPPLGWTRRLGAAVCQCTGGSQLRGDDGGRKDVEPDLRVPTPADKELLGALRTWGVTESLWGALGACGSAQR